MDDDPNLRKINLEILTEVKKNNEMLAQLIEMLKPLVSSNLISAEELPRLPDSIKNFHEMEEKFSMLGDGETDEVGFQGIHEQKSHELESLWQWAGAVDLRKRCILRTFWISKESGPVEVNKKLRKIWGGLFGGVESISPDIQEKFAQSLLETKKIINK